MKKIILLACLIVLMSSIVLMIIVLPITGYYKSPEIPPDPFTTTWSFAEEGRTLSISGNSAGHAACKPSEFQLTLDNHSSDTPWCGHYCILLINREEIVEEIACEEFDVPAGQEMRKPLTVTFPVDVVKGAIGLCVVIPQYASMVTTLWVGEKKTDSVEPWPDITTCPHCLTEEGSRKLADAFVRNSPAFVQVSIDSEEGGLIL